MKTFDTALIAELLKQEAIPFWFIDLDLVSATYRYTDMDIDYVLDGNRYYARDVSIGNITGNAGMSVDSVSLSISNADLIISTLFMAEEVRGRPITLSMSAFRKRGEEKVYDIAGNVVVAIAGDDVVVRDAGISLVGSISPLWRGLISSYRITDNAVEIELVSELILWNKKPLRQQTASCRWNFKGAECRYAGAETTCDQTYDRCTALSNTDNFGGFRWLPDMMEMELWWGKVPSSS